MSALDLLRFANIGQLATTELSKEGKTATTVPAMSLMAAMITAIDNAASLVMERKARLQCAHPCMCAAMGDTSPTMITPEKNATTAMLLAALTTASLSLAGAASTYRITVQFVLMSAAIEPGSIFLANSAMTATS